MSWSAVNRQQLQLMWKSETWIQVDQLPHLLYSVGLVFYFIWLGPFCIGYTGFGSPRTRLNTLSILSCLVSSSLRNGWSPLCIPAHGEEGIQEGHVPESIFDSGRGEDRWSVSKCVQQFLAEQIMEAVTENLLNELHKGCQWFSCVRLFWRWKLLVWEHSECNPPRGFDGIFCLYSAFFQCFECICSYQQLKDKLGNLPVTSTEMLPFQD